MYNDNSLNKPEQIFLNFNANKIRWLTNSKVMPTNLFCIGSGENLQKLSIWRAGTNSSDKFEPLFMCESEDLDGIVTELKAKNTEEVFLSTSNGSIYHFKYSHNEQKLNLANKWSLESNQIENFNFISSFDFNSDCDEICFVNENGKISFIRLHLNPSEALYTLNHNELCCLNSVLYLKQFEVAIADSLGRVKIWDTRIRDNKKASSIFYLEGESSPITCLANHPNQQHMVACGNLDGFVFTYDVRSLKKPFILSHSNNEPVMEICFHPFSTDNLYSSSFNGSLLYWNSSNKNELSTWDDRVVNARNYLPNNRYSLNSFDINNDQILAVNNNFGLFRIKMNNFL